MAPLKYLDGTTDITRTVHFGKPSAHEKACYTAVGFFIVLLSELLVIFWYLTSLQLR